MNRAELIKDVQSDIADCKVRLGGQLKSIELQCQSIRRMMEQGRMLNSLGEFQGEASKADAMIGQLATLERIMNKLAEK